MIDFCVHRIVCADNHNCITDFIKNEGFPKHLIEQLEYEKEREKREKEREELEKAMCKVNDVLFDITHVIFIVMEPL